MSPIYDKQLEELALRCRVKVQFETNKEFVYITGLPFLPTALSFRSFNRLGVSKILGLGGNSSQLLLSGVMIPHVSWNSDKDHVYILVASSV